MTSIGLFISLGFMKVEGGASTEFFAFSPRLLCIVRLPRMKMVFDIEFIVGISYLA